VGSAGKGGSDAVTNKNADDAFGLVKWDDAVLEAEKAITPAAPGEKPETRVDQLRRTLRVSVWSPSLTLLYFHTPHADLAKDKLVGPALAALNQCKTFSDDDVTKWLTLYHCVEVDMGKSDLATAQALGFKDGALFSVVDQDMNILATSKPLPKSENVASFLKATLKSDACKTFWAPVQKQIDEQKKWLEEGRALAEKKQWKQALEKYQFVLNSNVRIADFYDDAAKEVVKVQRKAEEAK
jgi:hypothetical protein